MTIVADLLGLQELDSGLDACAREIYEEWAVCRHFELYDDVRPTLEELAAGGVPPGFRWGLPDVPVTAPAMAPAAPLLRSADRSGAPSGRTLTQADVDAIADAVREGSRTGSREGSRDGTRSALRGAI